MRWLLLVGLLFLTSANATPASRVIPDLPLLTGILRPSQLIQLAPVAEGCLVETCFERGDRVEKGQVLAILDSSVEAAAVKILAARSEQCARIEGARIQADHTGRQLGIKESLFRDGLITPVEIEEVRTLNQLADLEVLEAEEELRQAVLEHERARVNLERRKIVSPLTGVVVERKLSVGELATPTLAVFKLAQLDPLVIEIHVPVRLLTHLRLGMQAEVHLDAPYETPHLATVTVIDRIADAATETVGIRLELPNAELALPAGLRCRVQLSAAD